jgi:hypothetical protein
MTSALGRRFSPRRYPLHRQPNAGSLPDLLFCGRPATSGGTKIFMRFDLSEFRCDRRPNRATRHRHR